nr:hypothetical protein [Microbacterium oryzae]
MTRHDGHRVSQATVLRLLRDDGLILPSEYQEAAPPAREGPQGGDRENPDRAEPGVAAGLQRVRDHRGWDLADRGVSGLVLEAGAPVPCVADREPVRRDRGDRAGSRRVRARSPKSKACSNSRTRCVR